jgi:uncharacterized lipoprotein YajG
MKSLICAAALLLLAGCASGPQYAPTELPPPPKPKAPPAATAPIHPPGWFQRELTRILSS